MSYYYNLTLILYEGIVLINTDNWKWWALIKMDQVFKITQQQ